MQQSLLPDGDSPELTRIRKQQLREVGWNKATEMVKVARRDGRNIATRWEEGKMEAELRVR